ncbi:alpha/beta hydrolase [Halomonas piscis]|uniref:alpha/beta hydrolase n=1 Tax=Halomonas piscis TaxID=3031727 RepID=UPI00289A700A|nr:alpha/beta fold hydrolase [Halomonas piscis]
MTQQSELIIEPLSGRPANACVFILHGLGADGYDFEPLVPQLDLPAGAEVRFIMPHAPRLAVSVNNGMTMPAWYDILSVDLGRELDTGQLASSAERIQRLMRDQIEAGIDSRRIVVAGFSQGGAVAYQAALTFDQPLAGLLAMSTYLADPDVPGPGDGAALPIEAHHGTADPVVPESLGRQGVEALRALGYAVEYRTYDMAHALCPEQIGDISRFLGARLG